ncbi:testicular haploid expressed protein-like isoform A [Alligator mississippiensis]|uniref:Testicular haploid expressed protein-like isoform A n=2 Tax=Alligator mississippiensis TaxID=8496 RepID=A0A151MPQ1_ALLMI|nr:testicular haploid expressed protein-like isoform A [Alligator mississippiensis]
MGSRWWLYCQLEGPRVPLSSQDVVEQGDVNSDEERDPGHCGHPEELSFLRSGSSKAWSLLRLEGKYFFSLHCSYSSYRIRELAKPKPKVAWENYCSRLDWGNQETIWPLSLSALATRPSPRLTALAKPKKNFDGKLQRRPLFLYSCGRESEIWERPPLMNLGFPSDRILKLAEPKKFQLAYLQKRARNSPEWPVTPAALTCEASQRVLDLAHPKSMHPDFIQAREAETHVTDTAKTARVSQRIKHLAQPRVQKDSWCYDRGHPEAVIWPVSKSAQQATANSRTSELAKAKQVSPKYLPVRDAEWPVSKAAKHTAATPRTVELSKPSKKPPMNIAQLNPDAFTVKESAKKAFCSSRILELARPIAR